MLAVSGLRSGSDLLLTSGCFVWNLFASDCTKPPQGAVRCSSPSPQYPPQSALRQWKLRGWSLVGVVGKVPSPLGTVLPSPVQGRWVVVKTYVEKLGSLERGGGGAKDASIPQMPFFHHHHPPPLLTPCSLPPIWNALLCPATHNHCSRPGSRPKPHFLEDTPLVPLCPHL